MGRAKQTAKPKTVETRIKNKDLIDLRRKQIVEGAIKCFVAKGFHKATVREIAEAAGLTMGSMYNYINTKEDIIYIVYDHITRTLRDSMFLAIASLEDPAERLKAALRHNLETINRHSDVIMFLYNSSGYLDRESLHEVLARETEYIELFEQLLRESLAGRKINETRLKIAADMMAFIPVMVTFRRWSLRRRFKSVEEVMEGMLNFILYGVEFVPAEAEKLFQWS